MGVMTPLPSLIVTPHPVTLDGQRALAAELRTGENLGAFLARTVPDYEGDVWEVRINGVVVPHEVMHRVRPKGGTVIEVRGVVGKTALLIVAMIALTIFTAGVGTAMVAAGYSAMAAGLAQAAIYAVGSLLINKVLGPKPPKPTESDAAAVFNLGGSRNQARPYEPLALLLGSVRIAPDLASNPYSWYEANDQYMAMLMAPGLNVGRIDELYNGDALLSVYEGVQVWHSGFPGMPEQQIPLYSNADTISGGALEAEKGQPSAWVQRTSSPNTIRLKVDMDFMLFDTTSKGKKKDNSETIEVQYKVAGATNWMPFGSYHITSNSQKQQRRSYSLDVHEGQYDVRVRIAGRNTDGKGATSDFTWSTLTSIQTDNASYAGIPRIGVRIKATGQLNGSPDEIRCVAHSSPVPVWNGQTWVIEETSNPGAHILAYARGFRDPEGQLIAGLGLTDAQIDVAALQAFMLHCAAGGLAYDNLIRDVRSHDDVLQAVALAGFGQVTWAAGRLSVVWAADGQPLSGVVNMATIKKGQFQVDYTLANAADGIEFSYFDRTDWSTKTLRVTAPGVETMLNPAQLTGEGITNEAHAAKMARYHLAQSLYQYKDITYSTDIEHLSYRRLSVLALQHDLTQWGFGGRLVSVELEASEAILELDEPVPPAANGNAFIGLRIPGERVYRVFRVRPINAETRRIHLMDPWPADAPLPGNTPENPAHDTIWIYDFKQTPGYRVRVVGVEPESDLKGASVTVVPEGPEFWHYVESGEYIPSPGGSHLQTRPIASNLQVTEQQVVQGNTVFTELTATFDITGPVDDVVVLSDMDGNGELEQVATTRTRTATWRIPGAGEYAIVVRPYSPDGLAGEAVSVTFRTVGAGAAPVLVDHLYISEEPGGVRRYSWSFDTDTIQSPDFVGVQIRYIDGSVPAPNWADMTPLGGEAGFHAAAFDSVLPVAGSWTFAVRSVNTAGDLSLSMRTVQKVLAKNLGEQTLEVVQQLTRHEQEILKAIEDIDENAASIVKQSVAQFDLQDTARTHRAYLSRLEEAKVDADGARAISQEVISASVGDLRSAVQETKNVVAGMNGRLEASWSYKAQVTENGRYYMAGISAGVYVDGATVQREVIVLAETFEILTDDAFGNAYRPFIVDRGVVYLDEARIRNGSITNAKIGEVIQSANFVWDVGSGTYAGWRLNKDGSALFAGDVTIRGTVIADSITGLFQRRNTWSWEGTISPDAGGFTPTFVLDAPVRVGDAHTPQLLIELTMDNGGDHSRDGVVTLEVYNGSEWQAVRQKVFTMAASTNVTNFMIVQDSQATVARQYRIRISRGTNRWGSWTFKGAYVTMQGVR